MGGEVSSVPMSSELRYPTRTVDVENRVIDINKNSYMFRRKLGSGAFGSVYSARGLTTGSPVAVKVVSLSSMSTSESQCLARSILNEIEMSKRLSRAIKGIVKLYDFDFDQRTGLAFLVMELGKKSLEAELTERGHLSTTEKQEIWKQLVDIAMILHSNNIVHLDIKPDNIIVFPRNRVKLADLGIAQKAYEKSVGRNGTWYYSAPEVTNASSHRTTSHTTKADVWSWGAVLYRMTYQKAPGYHHPCHYPPENQLKSRNAALIDILRRTLVLDPRSRVDTPWLKNHLF